MSSWTHLFQFGVGNDPLRYHFSYALQYHIRFLSVGVGAQQITLPELDGTGGYFGLWFDKLLAEPYIVPYVKWGQMRNSQETASTPFLSYGILLQLNSLDETSALRALADFGLENTYLDLFLLSGSDLINSKGQQVNLGISIQF